MPIGEAGDCATLKRIAAGLRIAPEDFMNVDKLRRWESIAEGLRLLQGIESEAGLCRALEGLRSIAAEEGRPTA